MILTGNDSVSIPQQCGTVQAHIGDVISIDVGTFALVYDTMYQGPDPDSGGSASLSYTVDATITSAAPTTAVPTLTEWGMILFAALAGLGAVYYLRRREMTNA